MGSTKKELEEYGTGTLKKAKIQLQRGAASKKRPVASGSKSSWDHYFCKPK